MFNFLNNSNSKRHKSLLQQQDNLSFENKYRFNTVSESFNQINLEMKQNKSNSIEEENESVMNTDSIRTTDTATSEMTIIDDESIDISRQYTPKLRKPMQTSQSRQLPIFILKAIMLITGIVNTNEKQNTAKIRLHAIVSTFLNFLTMSFAFVFILTNTWVLVIDKNTNITILNRCVTLCLALNWCAIGVYSINVLFNLYSLKELQNAIRLRTKSYFRVPAALILFVLILLFSYIKVDYMNDEVRACRNSTDISVILCELKFYFTFLYSILATFWSFLVALTVMFIIRSCTIDIRHFIFDLESDSIQIIKIFKKFNKNIFTTTVNSPEHGDDHEFILISQYASVDAKTNPSIGGLTEDLVECKCCLARFTGKTSDGSFCKHIQSPNEIFLSYWKLASNLRLISNLIQRWVLGSITTILLSSLSCLVYWIRNTEPSFINIGQFILPLMMLALVCGTFAELNAEGNKCIRHIMPLSERLFMLNYFNQNPLQMRVYGFSIDYSAELKFIGAFAIGFLTQIIYHEIGS